MPRRKGAENLILGRTEVGTILDPPARPLPGFDSADIHAAAVDFAPGGHVD